MKRQEKGSCHLSRHRQVLHECWRELISSLLLCNPTRGIWCSFLGDCLPESYCQRSEESGKICCYARGIDLWRKIKICVAQINVDWDWSRREKCNTVQIPKEYLHQKRRWISQYHARSSAITNSMKLGERKSSLFISSWRSETHSCFQQIPFPPTKIRSRNPWNIHGTFRAILFFLIVCCIFPTGLQLIYLHCVLFGREDSSNKG